jgi:hypothetical protein
MKMASLHKFLFAYLNAAASASVFYLCFSELPRETPLETLLFLYWLLVGALFGVASTALLLSWPRRQVAQRIAICSLIPIGLFIAGVRLFLPAAA